MLPSWEGSLCRAGTRAPIRLETFLIHAFLVLAFVTSSSDVAHAAPAWAAECAATDDDAARLTCYDSRNPPHKSAARTQGSVPPAVSAKATAAGASRDDASRNDTPRTEPRNAASAAASKSQPGSDFGLPPKSDPETAKARATESDLIAHVASVSEKLTGELLLKLDNGQTWVQAQRKPGTYIKANERVTIARGTFGGFLLSSDSGVTMRVRRLE